MIIRTIQATIDHTESGTQEVKEVTILDDTPEYELVKLYVVEYGKSVVFDRNTNTILLPD